jgi:hypothetical protein
MKLPSSGARLGNNLDLSNEVLIQHASTPAWAKVLRAVCKVPVPMKFRRHVPQQVATVVGCVAKDRVSFQKLDHMVFELGGNVWCEKKDRSRGHL